MTLRRLSAAEFLSMPVESLKSSAEAISDESALAWLSSPPGSAEDRAAAALGALLAENYADRWLRDASGEVRAAPARTLAARVRDAAAANRKGDSEEALRILAHAPGVPAPALAARLAFERTYALHRSLRAAECAASASRLSAALAHQPYLWLSANTAIEHATCTALLGREGEAVAELKTTQDRLETSPYRDLRLRARGILADIQTNSGDPWAIWSVAQSGLAEWWTGAAAPNRAQQFLIDLSQASTYLEYPHAAFLFARAGSEMIAATPNAMTEALSRVRAASLATAAHRGPDAVAQLQRAGGILAAMGSTKTARNYAPVMDNALASADLAMNQPQAAIRRLEESRTAIPTAPTFLSGFQRSLLLGIAYARLNDPLRAQPYLEQTARTLEQRLRSLATRRERLAALTEARPALLAQVKLLLDRPDPDAALAAWASYLQAGAAPAADCGAGASACQPGRSPGSVLTPTPSKTSQSPAPGPCGAGASACQPGRSPGSVFAPILAPAAPALLPAQGQPCTGAGLHPNLCAAQALPDGNWLVYAAIGDAYAAWLVRDRQARYFPIAGSAEIDAMAARLLALAAWPERNTGERKELASRLYARLVAPVARFLDPARPVHIIPDGSLAQVPFALLADERGVLLGETFPLITAGSLGVEEKPSLPRTLAGLVVSNALVPESLAGQFPYLPNVREESLSVLRSFPRSSLLADREATLPRVLRAAPSAEIFHFSGHAFSNGGHGALVLAADPDPATGFLLTSESIARLKLNRCMLTVLAGCVTAIGEKNGPSNPASLVRAFLMAGSRQVIASNWSVDSAATRLLFDRFYAELAGGTTVSGALWRASQWLRRQPGYADPFYWAAFQVFE